MASCKVAVGYRYLTQVEVGGRSVMATCTRRNKGEVATAGRAPIVNSYRMPCRCVLCPPSMYDIERSSSSCRRRLAREVII